MSDDRVVIVDGPLQVQDCGGNNLRHLCRPKHELGALRLGECQQVRNQRLHSAGPVNDGRDKAARFVVEQVLVTSFEQLRISRHHAERLLQIMTGSVGELPEVIIGFQQGRIRGGQLGVDASQLSDRLFRSPACHQQFLLVAAPFPGMEHCHPVQ